MYICLVNTPELSTQTTHMLTSSKFCRGWENLGFKKVEITSFEQLKDIPDDELTVFLISNQSLEGNYDINRLKPFSRFTKATKLLWHFHTYLRLGNEVPFNNWILTGEHYRRPVQSEEHKKSYAFQQTLKNYHPLTFSCYLSPEEVGTYPRDNVKYDSFFCGHEYQKVWLDKLKAKGNSLINTNPMTMAEQDRINGFLSSHTSLGFHSTNNILNSCLVERVYEGMGFGTVVLSDNPVAPDATDGVVEYISSFEELEDKIDFYKTHAEFAEKKREKGYHFIRNQGTYLHVATGFIEKMTELGYVK